VQFFGAMFGPIISLLKPVSPLAWLPIGLLVFKSANPAAIWSIFICSIWPMIINTAVGVQRVPQDYMNVARVLNLSEWKVLTKILLPSALPYILTGVRLAIGTAWLVIVAAEMLTGGVGIGFWVWDEWNNLNVPHIIIAIVIIGVVGLLLEQALMALARAFTYEQVPTKEPMNASTPKFIDIAGVEMAFHTKKGVFHALREIDLPSQGRIRHADRPLRLRQIDAAEPDRRAVETDRGRAAVREPRNRRTVAGAGGGVPEPLAAALADLRREHPPRRRARVRATETRAQLRERTMRRWRWSA
jgi:nitrate ABC transporter permease subunit